MDDLELENLQLSKRPLSEKLSKVCQKLNRLGNLDFSECLRMMSEGRTFIFFLFQLLLKRGRSQKIETLVGSFIVLGFFFCSLIVIKSLKMARILSLMV